MKLHTNYEILLTLIFGVNPYIMKLHTKYCKESKVQLVVARYAY